MARIVDYTENILSDSKVEFFIKFLLFVALIALLFSHNTRHIAERMFWLDEVTTFKS